MRPAISILVSILLLTGHSGQVRLPADQPVVHAVLFYSPSCSHCYYVINEVLPPLFEQYGNQLQMVGISIASPDGYDVFLAALDLHGIAPEYGGVPFLVVGDTYLLGDVDIPQQFPGLVEYYLSQGGVDWPLIPRLPELLAGMDSTQDAQETPAEETPTLAPTVTGQSEAMPASTPVEEPDSIALVGEETIGLWDRLAQDPAGNSLAILVLIGMVVALGWSIWSLARPVARQTGSTSLWLVPILCAAGLGVAGYLSYVEVTQVEAVCGPVGDCNTVQQSEYARLFGVLPIGVLGMVGYVAIIVSWLFARWANKGAIRDLGALALLTMTVFGTIFSIYLTFLEPFLIGATCAWCLTSAVLMTILMLLSVAPGKQALNRLVLMYKE